MSSEIPRGSNWTTTRAQLRSVILLVAGFVAVFSAHVGLPYLLVSGGRAGVLPNWVFSLMDRPDPALWFVVFPTAFACMGYSYVLNHCGEMWVFSRRCVRWPIVLAAAFLSLWAQMFLMINSFGS